MSIRIYGATSGYVDLDAPAVAGSASVTVTLPATAGTVALTSSPTLTSPTLTGTVTMTGATVLGGGLDFVKSQAFTTVSSVIISNAFATDWENYRVIVDLRSYATSGGMNAQLRSGGTTITTNYRGQRLYATGATVAGIATSTTSWEIGYINNGYPDYSPTIFDVFSPFLAIPKKIICTSVEDNGTARTLNLFGQALNSTSSCPDLVLNFPGNSTGTALIYGYRKA